MYGKRYSRQRELIYRCVQSSRAHPTAEMVYRELRLLHPNLSMGTVYRNLNLLAVEGALIRMPFPVERYDAAITPHNHFRCTKCESVLDLEGPYQVELDEIARRQSGYHITGHSLIFEGICPVCMEQVNI